MTTKEQRFDAAMIQQCREWLIADTDKASGGKLPRCPQCNGKAVRALHRPRAWVCAQGHETLVSKVKQQPWTEREVQQLDSEILQRRLIREEEARREREFERARQARLRELRQGGKGG